jgi:hypothetical protein
VERDNLVDVAALDGVGEAPDQSALARSSARGALAIDGRQPFSERSRRPRGKTLTAIET